MIKGCCEGCESKKCEIPVMRARETSFVVLFEVMLNLVSICDISFAYLLRYKVFSPRVKFLYRAFHILFCYFYWFC